MDERKESARKADRAASAISDGMIKSLKEIRPAFADRYDLDDQLVTLAIAKAAIGIAADAVSDATGMAEEKCVDLEERLNDVVFEAMNELLGDAE